MPFLAPAALAVAGWVTAELAITSTVAFYAIAAAAQVGIMAASSALSGALAPKPKGGGAINSPIGLQMVSGEARTWAYGEAATGGIIKYWETQGDKNENLWLVVAVHDTPCESFTKFVCDNTDVTFSSGVVQNKYITSGGAPMMWRYDKLGDPAQTAETNLDTASTIWTSNHRLRGVAYYVLKLLHDPKVYPTGMPQPTLWVKGRKLWDPRLDVGFGGSGSHLLADETTWQWSQNPAIALLDYLKGVNLNGKRIGGCGIPIDAFDMPSFMAAANVCDQNVDLAAGGTEKRYTANGFVDAIEDKEQVVEALLLAMHGTLVLRGGKLYLVAGAAQTSVMTLTDDDLVGELTINPSSSRQEKVNRITGAFSDPAQNFAPVPCAPLDVPQYVTDDGGIVLEREIRHRFTTSSTMVDRLNKLILSSFREQLSIVAAWKPKALEISAGDTFMWSSAAAGYTTPVKMICLRRELMPDGSVQIIARQETDAKYGWATGEEQAPPSFGVVQPGAAPQPPAAPTGFAITQQFGGALSLSWNAVANPFVTGYDLRYGADGGTFDAATVITEDLRSTAYTTTIVPEGSWRFYVRARDSYGQLGAVTSVIFEVDPIVIDAGTVDVFNIPAVALAAGLTPVEVVNSLPTTGNFQGRIVFLTTDNKLYRYNGSAFTSVVPTTDLTGTIVNAQIAANAITATNIANDAVTTPKIAANAVTSNEIASNTITAGNIAANAVTSSELAANSVIAGKIAANAVTSNEIAANSIIAGKIATGAINAGAIIVNDLIVTSHLIANAVTKTFSETNGSEVTATTSFASLVSPTASVTSDAVIVWCSIDVENEDSGNHVFGIQVKYESTVIYDTSINAFSVLGNSHTAFSLNVPHTPTSGNRTYEMLWKSDSTAVKAHNATITVLQAKR